jgi:3-dehydroquinate dehydratase II
MAKFLVVNGPNLNLLGIREPKVYGQHTLEDINQSLQTFAQANGHQLATFQSNAEGALIDRIHAARVENVDFIIINAGAFTHTSIALRDALLAIECPFIEVHLTNIYAREPFRHKSYLADIAVGVITGLGGFSYQAALEAAIYLLNQN